MSGRNLVIVRGNESADLDSAVASYTIAWILRNHGKSGSLACDEPYAHSFKKMIELLPSGPWDPKPYLPVGLDKLKESTTGLSLTAMGLDLNEFETSDQANKKEWACLILVDHNYYHEHEGPDRDDVPPIIGIIDHHEDSEQIMGNCPKIIEVPRASTCSLVGELYLQTTTGTNINQNISCLLASIIEHDAYHFDEGVKGIRWVDMDKKIYHDLMEQAAISSGRPSEEIVCAHRNAIKSQFKEYSESLVNLNISDALLNDNKIFHYNTYDLIFASMPVHLGALIDDKDDNCVSDEFAKYVTACAGKNKTTTDLFICLSRGSECRELAIAYMDSAEKLAAKIRDHLLGWGDNVCLKQEARPRKFGPWAIITLQLDRNKSRKIVEPHLRALFKD